MAIEIETSGTITLFTVSKLTLTGLSGNDNVIVYDGNIGVLATASPVGEFSYTTVGSEVFLDTDKLVYVVIRPGYTDFFGAWDTTADLSLPFSATQFTQGNGSPMYQATSDVLWGRCSSRRLLTLRGSSSTLSWRTMRPPGRSGRRSATAPRSPLPTRR